MHLQTPETKRQRAAAQTSPKRAAQPAAESAGAPSTTDQPVLLAAAPGTLIMASPATSTMELTGLQLFCSAPGCGCSIGDRCLSCWCARSAGHTGTFPWQSQASPGVTASVPSLGEPSQQHVTEPSLPAAKAQGQHDPQSGAACLDSRQHGANYSAVLLRSAEAQSAAIAAPCSHLGSVSPCCALAVSGDLLADQTDSCSLQRAAAVSEGQLQEQQQGTVTLEVPQLSTLVEEDEEGPCSIAGVSRGGATATEGLELTGPTGDTSCTHKGVSKQREGNCQCQPWRGNVTNALELAAPPRDPTTCAEVCLASNQEGVVVSHGRTMPQRRPGAEWHQNLAAWHPDGVPA